ncbi:MAG TPA: hypothetical protein VIP98_22635 [Microlunatus sp.]
MPRPPEDDRAEPDRFGEPYPESEWAEDLPEQDLPGGDDPVRSTAPNLRPRWPAKLFRRGGRADRQPGADD